MHCVRLNMLLLPSPEPVVLKLTSKVSEFVVYVATHTESMIAGMSASSWAPVVTVKQRRRRWIETAAAIKKGSSASALVVAAATATLVSRSGVLAH